MNSDLSIMDRSGVLMMRIVFYSVARRISLSFVSMEVLFFTGAQNTQQTAKMHLTSNGDLGIGTTSSRGKLDIWGGTLHVTGSDLNGTLVGGSQSGNAWFGCNDLTNGLSISSAGGVGIGKVSTDFKLDVNGTARANEMTLTMQMPMAPDWFSGRREMLNGGSGISMGLHFIRVKGLPTSLWLDI